MFQQTRSVVRSAIQCRHKTKQLLQKPPLGNTEGWTGRSTIRVNSYIRENYGLTKTQIMTYLNEGRVRYQGKVISLPGLKIPVNTTEFEIDLGFSWTTYAINKPVGILSKPEGRRKWVTDILPPTPKVAPSGRLDLDSSGLMILSNNGKLVFDLIHPDKLIEKEYYVRVANPIPDGCLNKIAAGTKIKGVRTKKTAVQRLSATEFNITLVEGKNRQIRNMCKTVGHLVVQLHRFRIGSFFLPNDTEPGAYKILSEEEVALLTTNPERDTEDDTTKE